MRAYLKSAVQLLELARHVKRQHHKGFTRQLSDIARLVSRNPTCGISDYYRYGMYDAKHFASSIERFAGWKTGGDISLMLNPRNVVAPAWDKLLFMVLLDAYGLPRAGVKALYRPTALDLNSIPANLKSVPDLAAYLRSSRNFPLYAKPVYSQQGIGGALFVRYDMETDSLVECDGNRLSIQRFVDDYINRESPYYSREAGYLFQEVIRQHQEVSQFQGHSNISGIRLAIVNDPGGKAVPVRAVWKLSRKDRSNDNFSLGKYGNLIARIDLETGRPAYAIDGMWPYCRIYTAHPSTGIRFSDFQIPNWARILDLAAKAACIVPTMGFQHWDIAIGPEGPVFIELNDIGGLEILQSHGEGILVEPILDLLRKKNFSVNGRRLQRLLGRGN